LDSTPPHTSASSLDFCARYGLPGCCVIAPARLDAPCATPAAPRYSYVPPHVFGSQFGSHAPHSSGRCTLGVAATWILLLFLVHSSSFCYIAFPWFFPTFPFTSPPTFPSFTFSGSSSPPGASYTTPGFPCLVYTFLPTPSHPHLPTYTTSWILHSSVFVRSLTPFYTRAACTTTLSGFTSTTALGFWFRFTLHGRAPAPPYMHSWFTVARSLPAYVYDYPWFY